jgi:hypothetical protein
MRTNVKVMGAAAIVAALAAGGSAFTASNTMPVDAQHVGYGTTNVSGATVDHIDYNIDANDVSKLDGVTVWLLGDYTSSTVTVQWNNDGSDPAAYAPVTCTNKGYDGTTDTEFDCTAPINTADATSLDVTVTTTPKS